jgi:hypothetical protein
MALCRIAACVSSPASADRRRERELPFALAERGMVVGGHRGMGMNAVGAPPGARVGVARERENTLLSFGRAAEHAAVSFVEFDVQVCFSLRSCTGLEGWSRGCGPGVHRGIARQDWKVVWLIKTCALQCCN